MTISFKAAGALSAALLIGALAVPVGAQTAPAVHAEPMAPSPVPADVPQGGKIRIGVGTVKVLPALNKQLSASDQGLAIDRACETIEGQLTDALQNTRKFEIVARQDLNDLLKEQSLTPGVIIDNADPKAAVPAKIKGLQYLTLVTIDDFVDTGVSTFSPEMGFAASRRSLRMSAIVRVYNTSTGLLLESMTVPVQIESTGTARAVPGENAKNPKAVDDSVYVALVNQLSKAAAQRVVDAVYPARIIAVTGDFVTLNRGAGTLIDRNQLWEVFAVGQELKDPDTNEVLGREEMKIAEVIITDVLPKFSKGQVYGENRGIATGMIIRPKVQIQPAAATTPAVSPAVSR